MQLTSSQFCGGLQHDLGSSCYRAAALHCALDWSIGVQTDMKRHTDDFRLSLQLLVHKSLGNILCKTFWTQKLYLTF